MKEKLKRKCIVMAICVVIGIIVFALSLVLKGLSESQQGYMSGFGLSFSIASCIILIKNLTSMKNAKTLRDREIELTDERNIEISRKTMAITFRVSLAIQSALSIVLSIFMNNELGMYLGLLIGIELIVYVISNIIVSRNI